MDNRKDPVPADLSALLASLPDARSAAEAGLTSEDLQADWGEPVRVSRLLIEGEGGVRLAAPTDRPTLRETEHLHRLPATPGRPGTWLLLVERAWARPAAPIHLASGDLMSAGSVPLRVSYLLALGDRGASTWSRLRWVPPPIDGCPVEIDRDSGIVHVNGRPLPRALCKESVEVLSVLIEAYPDAVQPAELKRRIAGDPGGLLRHLRRTYVELRAAIQAPGKRWGGEGWRILPPDSD